MLIYKNVPLRYYNTFGVDHMADCIIHIRNNKEASSLFSGEILCKKPLLIIGGGSNILFTSDFNGTILYPKFLGIRIEKQDKHYASVSAGAGVNWDKLVEWTVNKGFGGLENLSLIPGTVGATPVQNIGAYGVEVKDLIYKVKAISVKDGSLKEFTNSECKFGYRDSIFKGKLKGKYLITRVCYRLNINPLLKVDYGSLKDELNNLGEPSLKNVRQAVINIRRNKLPDPEDIGNAGSFFKNPVVPFQLAAKIRWDNPLMPSYKDVSGGIKLAAGWLIEQCGWKGKRIGDAGVHDKQALVIVNHGKATGKEIYNLSEQIRKSVLGKFGIDLEREVEIIGTT
jgi:UDP-N-acetylmuramate dehydrogenase